MLLEELYGARHRGAARRSESRELHRDGSNTSVVNVAL